MDNMTLHYKILHMTQFRMCCKTDSDLDVTISVKHYRPIIELLVYRQVDFHNLNFLLANALTIVAHVGYVLKYNGSVIMQNAAVSAVRAQDASQRSDEITVFV